jgi:hypothetical protein
VVLGGVLESTCPLLNVSTSQKTITRMSDVDGRKGREERGSGRHEILKSDERDLQGDPSEDGRMSFGAIHHLVHGAGFEFCSKQNVKPNPANNN